MKLRLETKRRSCMSLKSTIRKEFYSFFWTFFPVFRDSDTKIDFLIIFICFSGHASEGEERIFTPKLFLIKLIIVVSAADTFQRFANPFRVAKDGLIC